MSSRVCAVALIAAALGASALGCGTTSSSAGVPREFHGVNSQYARGDISQGLMNRLRGGGVRTIRIVMYWNAIQQTGGRCTASAPGGSCVWDDGDGYYDYDSLVEEAARAGIRVKFFVIGTAPHLSADNRTPPIFSDRQRRDWKRFLRAAVNRYGTNGAFWKENPGVPTKYVRWWQLWNEPSANQYWRPRPSPKQYGKLVKLGSSAVRGADRKAKVALAGVFGTPSGRGSIDSWVWFRKLFRVKGIAKRFDYAAVHPYAGGINGIKAQIKILRRALDQAGMKRKKIEITEHGFSSDPKASPAPMAVSPKKQKKLTKRSLTLFLNKRKAWNLAAHNLFAVKDSGQPTVCPWCRAAGMFTKSETAKGAWKSYRAVAG